MVFEKINFSWFYIFLGLSIYFFTKEYDAFGDFKIFYATAADIPLKANIYTNVYVNGFHYLYAPFFVVMLSWFTDCGLEVCAVFWKSINLLAFLRMFFLLKEYLPSSLSTKESNRIFLACFALSIALVYQNLHNLQFNLIMLWAVFESIKWIETKYFWIGALILGFVSCVKLLSLTIVFYLLFRGYYKMFLYTIASIVLFLFLPSLLIGHSYNMELLESWFALINPKNGVHNMDLSEKGLVSITSIIPSFFANTSETDENFQFRRHLIDLPTHYVVILVQIVRIAIVLFTFYFLKFSFFVKQNDMQKRLLEISYVLLASVLIAPHQQSYAFVVVLPSMLYLCFVLKELPKSKQFYLILVLVIVCGLLLNLEFYLGNFRKVYKYLKFAGLGGLLLVLPLALSLIKAQKPIENK